MKILQFKKIILSILCISLLTSCSTASFLRSPKTLNQGEVEISAGVVGVYDIPTSVVVVGYGVTDDFEIEVRAECDYISLTPRYQILNSEDHMIDLTVSNEFGISENRHHFGPGIMLGKRYTNFEPYFGYRYRAFYGDMKKIGQEKDWFKYHIENKNLLNTHYFMFGNTYYFSNHWFIRGEIGAIKPNSENFLPQWGLSIGKKF